ncbi:hypothetical protein MNV49_004330 [Pseudohyphozyma bogoriensis]|nr:hypothetical protein MNV49_004330 [Pseudohyphozyma bogoriensis]
MSSKEESPSFLASFEAFRTAVISITTPRTLNLDAKQSWDDGKGAELADNGVGGPVEKTQEELKKEANDCRRCEKWRDELVRDSPIVRFMLQHIALLPPPPGTEAALNSVPSPTPHLPLPIACSPCPATMAGGYSETMGVLLCQNRFFSKKHMEDALSHELVHAWDGRRFKVKGAWGEDLRAHACTEIRAENLSGDCRWGREITRRNFGFSKQHQACVRRRAILSVAANPNCKSREDAEKAVNEVWESCWPDTRPFDEIY